jgi:hypothetical protein
MAGAGRITEAQPAAQVCGRAPSGSWPDVQLLTRAAVACVVAVAAGASAGADASEDISVAPDVVRCAVRASPAAPQQQLAPAAGHAGTRQACAGVWGRAWPRGRHTWRLLAQPTPLTDPGCRGDQPAAVQHTRAACGQLDAAWRKQVVVVMAGAVMVVGQRRRLPAACTAWQARAFEHGQAHTGCPVIALTARVGLLSLHGHMQAHWTRWHRLVRERAPAMDCCNKVPMPR